MTVYNQGSAATADGATHHARVAYEGQILWSEESYDSIPPGVGLEFETDPVTVDAGVRSVIVDFDPMNEVPEANDGNKVDVVLEMSGGRVFDACAEALAPFGRIVAYGIASREQNTVETGRLMRKSRSVVGFWLMHCLGRRDMMEEPLADLFDRAVRGELVPQMGETYALSDVRRAHEDM